MSVGRSPQRSQGLDDDSRADRAGLQQQQLTQENRPATSSTSSSSVQIASAAVCKIPPFWKGNPKLWFIQVEAIFKINRITRGETKFDHILCNLDTTTLEFVEDLILTPPTNECKYEALKLKLINTFAESEEKRLRRLLTGYSIGDQKPTHYLQWMRNSASGQVSDSVLKALFLEQLPTNVRAILVGNKGNLDDIAEQADKILEQLSPSISAVSQTSHMEEILTKIEALENRFKDFRPRSPMRRENNSRRSSSRGRSSSRFFNQNWCWYHNNFKDKAVKCISPCTYLTKN